MASMTRTRIRTTTRRPAALNWGPETDAERWELNDDFPAVKTPRATTPAPRSTGGVSLDATEEAAARFGLTPVDLEGVRYGIEADPFMHRTDAEIDQDWAEWDAYQAAMSRWIDGRGPRPE